MRYDVIVAGGGIVGLASALQILEKRPRTSLLLVEKEKSVALHQTGNNSGVIHSGIYYKPGSLKATNCLNGYNLLLAFCNAHGIKYDLCGKIIVATQPSEIEMLKTIQDRGIANGLTGLKNLNKEQLAQYEPHVAGIAGLYVPQTGIIDYTEVSLKMADLITTKGGNLSFNSKVIELAEEGSDMVVTTSNGSYACSLFINCCGLYSDKIARLGHKAEEVKIIPFRGEYYELKAEKRHLVKNLIYPVPDPNFPFLGVHFTRMINGGVEAGPNAVLAYKREGYTKKDVNLWEFFESITWPGFIKVAKKYWKTGFGEFYRSYSKAAFTKALQKLIPEIRAQDLVIGGAGVRAQACDRNGGLLDDFKIIDDHNSIHVLNAPSPAATSSLSIGQTIAEMAIKKL